MFQSFAQKKLKVEVEFKYTKPDCEAAKHNKGTDAAGKPETPLTDCKFYIYFNNKCIDTIRTSENGTAIVRLLPGKYLLYEAWKHFKKTPDGSPISDFYNDCLQKEWKKPNYVLNISENNLTMDYNDVSASRCPNQYACLKVRHLPGEIKR